jgi:hypothetical protein
VAAGRRERGSSGVGGGDGWELGEEEEVGRGGRRKRRSGAVPQI